MFGVLWESHFGVQLYYLLNTLIIKGVCVCACMGVCVCLSLSLSLTNFTYNW